MTSTSAHPATETAVTAEELYSSSFSEHENVPTVRLSGEGIELESGVVGVIAEQGEVRPSSTPTAVAVNVQASVRDPDVEGGQSTRFLDHSGKRAEFISASFYKPVQSSPLGIQLRDVDSNVKIHGIKAGTPVSTSPLRQGDIVLSVNNKRCSEKMDSSAVGAKLRNAVGKVTIIVHNEGGASNLVESMVTKKNPEQKVGVGIKKDRNDNTVVTRVHQGLLSDSMINPGDQILSVNGTSCVHLCHTEVGKIMNHAPEQVTILAKTQRETGVVISEVSARFGETRRGNDEDEANNPPKKQMTAIAIIAFIVVVIFVGVFLPKTLGADDSQ